MPDSTPSIKQWVMEATDKMLPQIVEDIRDDYNGFRYRDQVYATRKRAEFERESEQKSFARIIQAEHDKAEGEKEEIARLKAEIEAQKKTLYQANMDFLDMRDQRDSARKKCRIAGGSVWQALLENRRSAALSTGATT